MVETWDSFGVVVGAASGALIGLLFVAISVNASRIAKHPALHVVASRTLVLFAIPLVAAILVVTPRQADWALGAELIVLGVVAGAALIFMGRGHVDVDASPESRLARTLDRTSPTLATSLLTEIAGVTLIVGGGGLYWLVPALILALVGGMLNAWLLLVGLPSHWRRRGPAPSEPAARHPAKTLIRPCPRRQDGRFVFAGDRPRVPWRGTAARPL